MLQRTLLALMLVLATAGLFTCQQIRVHRAMTALDRAHDALDRATAEKATLATQLELAQGTTRVVTEYVDRIQVVRERGDTIVKEVPVYVTPNADAACAVPAGFVQLHDAAATGQPAAGVAGDPDAPAAGLALSTVARTVASNYALCHATAEQVIGLQGLVRELHAALGGQEHAP